MNDTISSELQSLVSDDIEVSAWQNQFNSLICFENKPEALIYPKTVDAVSKIINKACYHRFPVLPCGQGTKLAWRNLKQAPQWIISSQKLNQIVDHAVGDLTITVQAGLKIKDLQAYLQSYNQFLPVDPAYPELVTVGGMVATADTGSWRQRYGGVRDLVLGLSFVRWDGKIAKAGGKVVKNVAGYDLMKLFTGSYGTLGMMTEVTFRLYPLPNESKTVILAGKPDEIATFRQNLVNTGLSPTCADIVSRSVMKTLNLGEEMGMVLRFQTIAESITEQINEVKKYAHPLNLIITEFSDQLEVNLWQQLQNTILIPSQENAISCKIGVIPDKVVNFLEEGDRLTQTEGLGVINLTTGVGKLHLSDHLSCTTLKQLRSLCQSYQGYLSLLEAPITVKQSIDPWGYNGNSMDLMRKIKQQFDPYNLFGDYL